MELNLGPLAQIPLGEGRNYQVGDGAVAVFNTRDGVYATQAECPHRKGPLADGFIGGATVICPFHSWKFDLTTGEPLLGQCGIQTYPVRLTASGEILLTWEGGAPHPTRAPQQEEIGVGQEAVGIAYGPTETAPVP